jgi:hypothetical protein
MQPWNQEMLYKPANRGLLNLIVYRRSQLNSTNVVWLLRHKLSCTMETSAKKIPNSKRYLSPNNAEIKKKLSQERRLAALKIRRRQLGKGQSVKEKTVFMCQTSPKVGKLNSGSTQRTRLHRFLERVRITYIQ